MSPTLDHVAVAVRDLGASIEAYRDFLGREPSWVGSGGGVRLAAFQLPNMALNLIAPEGEGPHGVALTAWLAERGEGLWAIAFAVPDLETAGHTIGRHGLTLQPVADFVTVSADGGTLTRRFVASDPATTAGVNVLFSDSGPLPLAQPISGNEAAAVLGLDHIVINTPNPDRALALYGARIGLDFRLERSNPAWGSKLMFFRAGDAVVEIGSSLQNTPDPAGPDRLSGMAWRVRDPEAARARIAAAGFDASEVRTGRKPGTKVFTVRSGVAGAPALMLSAENFGDDA